jgi:hypothetical protein
MEVYTIVQVGWEYNDEYYYQGENGGGNPLSCYKDRSKAEAAVLEKNIAEYRTIGSSRWNQLGAYFCDGEYDFDSDDIEELEKLGVTLSDDGITLPESASDEDMAQIIGLIGIVFYEITPLEYVE